MGLFYLVRFWSGTRGLMARTIFYLGVDLHNPVFFITSLDSGSLVIDSITAVGKLDAPTPQRVFRATMEGLIAGPLLFAGGADALEALQGLPSP